METPKSVLQIILGKYEIGGSPNTRARSSRKEKLFQEFSQQMLRLHFYFS
jgi:hypothetical protein